MNEMKMNGLLNGYFLLNCLTDYFLNFYYDLANKNGLNLCYALNE
jgi:hypothetical protein